MSNRLDSLEITNDTLLKGNLYCTNIEVESITNSGLILAGDMSFSENTIESLDGGIHINGGNNDNITLTSGSSNQAIDAGNIILNVGTTTGTNGKLTFIVGGVTYFWPAVGPTTNGQSLKVLSGGGTSDIVLHWG